MNIETNGEPDNTVPTPTGYYGEAESQNRWKTFKLEELGEEIVDNKADFWPGLLLKNVPNELHCTETLELTKLKEFVAQHFPESKDSPVDTVIAYVLATKKPEEKPKQTLWNFSVALHYKLSGGHSQFRNLENVVAATPAEAQILADKLARKLLTKDQWREVKIRPLGPVED